MKFLEVPELGLLVSALSSSSQSVRVMTRIEPYSCKSVASEKKMFKSLDQEFASDLGTSVSPPHPNLSVLDSAFGPLDRKDCRKTFWLLIATLNVAYPDHNFSHVKPEDFHKEETAREILLRMSEALEPDGSAGSNFASSLGALSISPHSMFERAVDGYRPWSTTDTLAGVHPLIRQILDPIIDFSQCEVFSYCPDPDSDPHAVDSDDESETESVASSIFAVERVGDIQHSFINVGEETMWEMEAVDTPLHLMNPSDSATIVPFPRSHDIMNSNSTILQERTFTGRPGQSDKYCSISARSKEAVKDRAREVSMLKRSDNTEVSRSKPYSSAGFEEESAGGLLWSSHYFFYNRKMKRVLFISIWARKVIASAEPRYVDYRLVGSRSPSAVVSNDCARSGSRVDTSAKESQLDILERFASLVERMGNPKRRHSLASPKALESSTERDSSANSNKAAQTDVSPVVNTSSRPNKKSKRIMEGIVQLDG